MPTRDLTSEYLPYCLVRQANGTHEILNHEMKTVAFRPDQFGITGDGAGFAHFEGITAGLAERLSYCGDGNLERIYLFDENSVPTDSAQLMADYLRRLELLTTRVSSHIK